MSKESIKANYQRVYEIYGIDPNDKRYNIHHIVFKRDVKKGLMKDFDVNQRSNLIPLKKEIHNSLHKRVDEMEHYHHNDMPKRRKKRRR